MKRAILYILLVLVGYTPAMVQHLSDEEAFRKSEELLAGSVNDEEKEILQQQYVLYGYRTACTYMSLTEGRYAEARAIFEKIFPLAGKEMRQRIMSKEPMAWYFEGSQYLIAQKYSPAMECMKNARDGFHRTGELKNEADAVFQIGIICNYLYDICGADAAFEHARTLAADTRYDTRLMSILTKQHQLYEQLGNSERQLKTEERIDSLAAATTENEIRFEYYSHLGHEAQKQNNFDLAEQWYKKNEPYIRQLTSTQKGLHYIYLKNLYIQSGQWDEALKYTRLSHAEHQKAFNDDNDGATYMNLAHIYRLMGDSLHCFLSLDTLFMSIDRLDDPRAKQHFYITRAICHARFKNYGRALADYRKADELLAAQYGENDGDRIDLLPLKGGMEHKLGHNDESEQLYRKYAENIRNLYGENHSRYIDALYYLANAEAFAGHIDDACIHYTASAEKLKRKIQEKLPYLSTAERESYWTSVAALLHDMTPFALKSKKYQTDFTRVCYDGLILTKAFLLESERTIFDLIKNNGTEEDLLLFTTLTSIQAKIKDWEKQGGHYADSIPELSSRIKQLETQLAIRCRSYGDMTAFMGIGYPEIKNRIGDGEVLIDFTDFVPETGDRIYAAYIIDNKQEYPLLKKLFAESTIDSLQVAYPDQYYENPSSEIMYQLLWEPFKDHVKEGATIYYVPSQKLFRVALESLPAEDGTLLGEHYHFIRLSSARELDRLHTRLDISRSPKTADAVLYGGLLYDLEDGDWKEETRKYRPSPSLPAIRDDIFRSNSVYRELPGSKKEVDAIAEILKSHRLTVDTYTGKQGTEESFLNMNGQAPSILHIATHGFFYTPDQAQKIDYLRGYKDAMLLSGLVMSGGNAAWLGRERPQGTLGGILTASRIARLDLGNTRLVVLSACQSGTGEATSEGLYGLQRAFKKAGAKTIIMSLWNVSDAVGTEFMTLFYKNLFDENQDKRKAFDTTKSAIRKKYPEPFYWAGFVMLD